jgi:hypothetical protein
LQGLSTPHFLYIFKTIATSFPSIMIPIADSGFTSSQKEEDTIPLSSMLLHTLNQHLLQQQSFHSPLSSTAPTEPYIPNSEISRNPYLISPSLTMDEAMNLFLQSSSSQVSQRPKRTLDHSIETPYAQRDDTNTDRTVDTPLLISRLSSRKKLKVTSVPPPMRRRQPRPPMQVPPLTGGPIELPGQRDVLCGRGGRINTHPGNVTLRELVSLRQLEYLSETTKKLDKAYIAAEIVATIRAQYGGRFLRQNAEDQYWYEIGDERAVRKVLQALREHAPQIRPMMAP